MSRIPAGAFPALATLLWAGNFVMGGPLVEVLPPFGLNLLRWTLACAVLVVLTLRYEGRGAFVAASRHWPTLVVMGIAGVTLYNSLIYSALVHTTSINAALINGAIPIATMLATAVLGGGLPRKQHLLGAVVGLAGVGVVVSGGSWAKLTTLSLNRGDAVVLMAVVCWAIYTALGARVSRSLSPLATTTASAVVALPILAVVGGFELWRGPVGEIGVGVVAGLLYIGIVASVIAYLAWNTGVARLGAARGAIFYNLIPVFTASIAVPVLGEKITTAHLVGGALVVLGVVVVASRPEKSPEDQ